MIRWAFTLIELLAVIGIFGALLLSALAHFKGSRKANSLRRQLEANCSGGIFVYERQFGLVASS